MIPQVEFMIMSGVKLIPNSIKEKMLLWLEKKHPEIYREAIERAIEDKQGGVNSEEDKNG